MLETLRAWLNGKKEYYTGVAIYTSLRNNAALVNLFKKGPTDFTTQRLRRELLDIYNELKPLSDVQCEIQSTESIDESTVQQRDPSLGSDKNPGGQSTERQGKSSSATVVSPVNEPLYNACKLAADNLYKEVMNKRAVLFSLAVADNYEDPNTADKIAPRVKLALEVITGYQKVSQLYDTADFVRVHGRLAIEPPKVDGETEYDHIPDHQVKQALDNLRKNFNKIKKRELTAERVLLLQKHEANIKKLEARWLSLNPAI